MAGGVSALAAIGHRAERGLLVGGGARSRAVQELAPEILGIPFVLPDPTVEWVARGAARQAAWALSGKDEPPAWPVPCVPCGRPDAPTGELAGEAVLAAYRRLLADVEPALRRSQPS
jgi:xylulokinase